MKQVLAAATILCATTAVSAMAEQVSFATDILGKPPEGWTATMTGTGNPKWTVEADDSAPSRSKILRQSGKATYPIVLKNNTKLKDGYVEVKFKAVSGSEDRAGGIVWRAKDANNYYVVRANALEDNVVLYKTVEGKRSSLNIIGETSGYGVKVPVAPGQWHTLRVEFRNTLFKVIFNGTPLFEVDDATFTEAGMVGLWTKADSNTLFDAFSYGER